MMHDVTRLRPQLALGMSSLFCPKTDSAREAFLLRV